MVRWDDCVVAVLRESGRFVVHHREVIVDGAKVAELPRIDWTEVVHSIVLNVFKLNLNKLVAIGMTVHVMIAQCMNELVHDGAALKAAVSIQRDALHSTEFPDVAPTAVAVENVNVINQISSSVKLVKADASVVLDVVQSGSEEDFLLGSYNE